MLEYLEHLVLLWHNVTIDMNNIMLSKNVSSADNQQERLKTIGWIIGFVDGEGCFSVSIIRNSTTKLGWQVFPEFVVTQEEKSIKSLEEIKNFFGCGNISINRNTRPNDNHREPLYRYCVRSIKDLQDKIIPFFIEHPLRTAKKKDFEKFTKIMEFIKKGRHLNKVGIGQIAKIIQTMNRRKPARFLESSEAIRQTILR